MKRMAFKMQLYPGMTKEYERRHDALWPELKQLLSESGISEYSIFLDEETNQLLGVLKIADPHSLDTLAVQPLMHKWWSYMKDLMETNDDDSPVSMPLKEVFYLP